LQTGNEASQHALTERGYELDREGQEAQNRANEAAVELERATARERSNTERVSELEARIAARARSWSRRGRSWPDRRGARAAASFLETAAGEAHGVPAEGGGAAAGGARRGRRGLYRGAGAGSEPPPRHAPADAGRQRAQLHIAQGEESLAALEREAERLEGEMGQARIEQENLGVESGESRHAL
jgi:chromosome segregation protein